MVILYVWSVYFHLVYDVLLGKVSSNETISLIIEIINTNTMTTSHSIEPTSGISSKYILVYTDYIILFILYYLLGTILNDEITIVFSKTSILFYNDDIYYY